VAVSRLGSYSQDMKRQVVTWVAIIAASLALGIFIDTRANADLGKPKLTISSVDIPRSHVQSSNGERGAAIAALSDGRFLLGGGKNGFALYLFDPATSSERVLGKVESYSQRFNDSRFAITDIGVLSQSANRVDAVVSYPRYDRIRDCVAVVLGAYQIDLGAKPSVKRTATWFTSKPCVPVSAVQHAAGRIEVIDKSNVFMTVGDLGFTKIDQVVTRQDLGSVFKINKSKVEKISQGHRNQQGILLIGKDLYASEHGPRGGDELNLITRGQDYGWPAVSFGQPYSSGDYIKPGVTGSHEGFAKPLTYWVPSVAPTELVQLPTTWGSWSSQIVMGTLREESLIFIQLTNRTTVGQITEVNVSERIRDLEISKDGHMIATTDSGKLLVIAPA
jgi:glucose/arabinose dehydrogenase